MALIKCYECGHDVSTHADRCPNCGARLAAGYAGAPSSTYPPLHPGAETVVCRARRHWLMFVPASALALFGALFFLAVDDRQLACVVLPLCWLWLLERYLTWRSTEVVVTTRRVTVNRGLFAGRADDFMLNQMEGIEVEQSLFGRILGYGTVVLKGSGGSRDRIDGLAYPWNVRHAAGAGTR